MPYRIVLASAYLNPHFSRTFDFQQSFCPPSSFSSLSVLNIYSYMPAEDSSCGLEGVKKFALKTDGRNWWTEK